ncbi:MAG: OmpA family protein [Myxococcales bacterium]|nr:OmpA family protein [Myxococcales bacterium]
MCPDAPEGPRGEPGARGCPRRLRDRDEDLIDDEDDRCPDEAAGETPDPGRAGCPDGDDDNDRIRNGADLCQREHAGFHPDPARLGCPLPDDDRDAVPNEVDQCLREAGAPSTNAARSGCPGLVRIVGDHIEILSPVYFATNRDALEGRSEAVLTAVADALLATRLIARLSVDGHTDDRDDDAHNLDLSQRRAHTVAQWLVAHGVNTERLESHGYGETRPLRALSATMPRRLRDAARSVNRRVEFRIVALGTPDGGTRPPPPAPPALSPEPAPTPTHRRPRHRAR